MENKHAEGLRKLMGLSEEEAEQALQGTHDDQIQQLFTEHMPLQQMPDTLQQRLKDLFTQEDFTIEN